MKLTRAVMIRSAVIIITIPLVCTGCNNRSKEIDTPIEAELHDVEADSSTFILEQEPEQLVRKRTLTQNDLYRDYDGGSQLKDYFEIELIDRQIFDEGRKNAVNYLITDTNTYKKVDGVLRLPLQRGGEITFKDNSTVGESYCDYTYVGQIEPLDMYLIWTLLWEDWHYTLIDKTKGTAVQSFVGLPYLSADKQYIICLDVDAAEGMSIIGLYTVTFDDKSPERYIDAVIEMYVRSWIPIDATRDIFWATDGFMYIQVAHNSNYWDAGNNFAGLEQYIRLKPIAA